MYHSYGLKRRALELIYIYMYIRIIILYNIYTVMKGLLHMRHLGKVHCHFTAFSLRFWFDKVMLLWGSAQKEIQPGLWRRRSSTTAAPELQLKFLTFYSLLPPRFVNCLWGEGTRNWGNFEKPRVPSTQVPCSFALYLHRHRRFEWGDVCHMAKQHATARAQCSRSARRCV